MLLTRIIGISYRKVLKPFFFRFDPEGVHDRVLFLGRVIGSSKILSAITRKIFYFEDDRLNQKVLGIDFQNPVGLSAGFDKDAHLTNTLPHVGFGWTEIGSVTLEPYEGNPKPRLYRLPKDKALVVYYGLKNDGVKVISKRIKEEFKKRNDFVLGISVARTNSKTASSVEAGVKDYKACLEYLAENKIGDYYTINISCPNTFYGEPYTTPDRLEKLLKEISKVKTDKPVFLKMPINLNWEEFDSLLKIIIKHNFKGVIIGNLNKDRNSKYITQDYPEELKGGVSGIPTKELSNNLIRKTYQKYKDKLIIVGVGGIDSAESAYEKISLGATLVQLITGMIYNGPQLIGEINKGLVEMMEKDGFQNISEVVGCRADK